MIIKSQDQSQRLKLEHFPACFLYAVRSAMLFINFPPRRRFLCTSFLTCAEEEDEAKGKYEIYYSRNVGA
jgi:hypothetical protein